jgi:hypothetical protein
MSTGLRPPSRLSHYLTTSARLAILVWIIAIVIVCIFVYFPGLKSNDTTQNVSPAPVPFGSQANTIQSGNDANTSQVEKLGKDSEALSQRLKSLENAIGGYETQFRRLEEVASQVPSRQAVERASTTVLATQVKSTRQRLQKLKTLQADWEAKTVSLLTGDSGRRIAASPTHLDLVAGLLDRERPTADQIVQWELQLEQLGTPVEQSLQDEKSKIAIVPEHAQQLTDLSQQVAKSLAEFERQQLLVDAVTKETAKTAPATTTLDEVLRQRWTVAEQARASQIASAKAEAEKAQTERLAAMEKEAIEAQTKRKELKQQAEQAQADQLAKVDVERIAEETRIKEAKQRAVVAGLKDEVLRIEEATRQAQLEQEFERELPDIRAHLKPMFAASNYQPIAGAMRRLTNTKGPMSLNAIRTAGALAEGRNGLFSLHATVNTDPERKKIGWPEFTTDSTEFLIHAQQYLIKYGDIMVKKGMLAP